MWMDLRATEQARRLTATEARVLKYCGGDVPAEWPLPKTLWLKEHARAQWNAAARLVEQMTWLTWRLTNEWVAPLNSAAAKWHYRSTSRNGAADDAVDGATGWPVDLLTRVGLEDALGKLPSRVVPMAGKAGELSAQAADVLGLRPGIAVAMSGIDAHAGMLGVGVHKPGAVALITGTSTCQLAQSNEAIFDRGLWGPVRRCGRAGRMDDRGGPGEHGRHGALAHGDRGRALAQRNALPKRGRRSRRDRPGRGGSRAARFLAGQPNAGQRSRGARHDLGPDERSRCGAPLARRLRRHGLWKPARARSARAQRRADGTDRRVWRRRAQRPLVADYRPTSRAFRSITPSRATRSPSAARCAPPSARARSPISRRRRKR